MTDDLTPPQRLKIRYNEAGDRAYIDRAWGIEYDHVANVWRLSMYPGWANNPMRKLSAEQIAAHRAMRAARWLLVVEAVAAIQTFASRFEPDRYSRSNTRHSSTSLTC